MGEVLVLGSGLTGLTSAIVLSDHGRPVRVLEASSYIGGSSRTVQWRDFRFDLGGHRLYTRNPEVLDLIHRLVGNELATVQRISRIYLNGHFVNYPLTFFNALAALGPFTSAAVAASYAAQKIKGVFRQHPVNTFEDWIVSRFGRKLYNIYFKTYSEKVWGMPCGELEADFAAQRIKGMSFREAVKSMFKRSSDAPATLVSEFIFPKLGFGRIPERIVELLPSGSVQTSSPVVKVRHDGARIRAIGVNDQRTLRWHEPEDVISTIPISDLVEMMEPAAPESVRQAARGLRFRDMIILFVALKRERVTNDHWIYFPDENIFFGRIHEPKNWSAAMAPPDRTGLVVEVFCYEHERVWQEPDEELLRRAAAKLEDLGLIRASELEGGCAVRLPKAYPLYSVGYREKLAEVMGYFKGFENLQCTGRNGMFRYTSGDRYIEMGLRAAQNLLGLASHDVDAIASEQEYAEN